MRKTNKILSIILAILMVMSIIPITASAATYSGTCGDNVTWIYDDTTFTLTISGTGTMYDYKSNNRPWENYEDKIKNIFIDNGITTIGNYAFYSCENIINVELPSTVIVIGESAFCACNELLSITIPYGVTTIGYRAFGSCTSLTNVTMTNSVTTIEQNAFISCTSLTSVTIPDSVTAIGKNAFLKCEVLSNIIVDDNNQYYSNDEYGVLFNKNKTNLIHYPGGCTEINYTVPNGVLTISDWAFAHAYDLISVTFAYGVTTIGKNAFHYCDNLTNVIIPDSVITIEYSAFLEWSHEPAGNLTDVYYTGTEEQWKSISIDDYNDRLINATIHYNYHIHEYNSVVTEPTCTEQGYTTYTCECGDSYVDDYVDVLDHDMIIDEAIAPDCVNTGLTEGSHCSRCDNATDEQEIIPALGHSHDAVITPPTCTEQGYTTYTCDCGDSYVDNYVDALGHIDNDNNNCCDKCSKYILPTSGTYGDNVTWTFDESTGTLTFSGTGAMEPFVASYGVPWNGHIDSIESVIISEGVTTITPSAFYYHENIKNVSMADSVTDIGERAFFNCTGLTDVVIGKGVTMIGEFAFQNCSNLKTVTIYNAVEKICRYAFNVGSKLTDVYYLGTEAEWNAIKKATLLSKTGLENATIHFLGEETHKCSYNAVVTPPTCTEQGYTTYTCECGDSFVDNYVDALGHDIVIDEAIAPDCVNVGLTEGSHCSRCDDVTTEQETVPALGHTYDFIVTSPTCTERGYTTYTCECGNSYVSDYVDALGHTEEVIPAVAPTCTETGLTEGAKCSICGETLTEQKELPANGHTPANPVEENYIVPTCTGNGSKDVVVYCSVCDEEISRETVTLDATGHTDNDGDGYCDADNELLDPSVECDHACHKDGISGFIWRIINFFNKLFGLNKTCSCGVAHY